MLRDEMQSSVRRLQIEFQYEKDKLCKDLDKYRTENEDLRN